MKRLVSVKYPQMTLEFCTEIDCLARDFCPGLKKHNRLFEYEETGMTPEQISAQRWIPVAVRMPEEHNSIVPGLGTVSKPVLVTWMDPTSDKTYSDNCFVREGITRNGEFTLQHINGDLIPIAWMPQPMPYEPPKEV